uniref:Epidermal growth factor n=1 Tax=Cyprinus carpio TaxID=7962 RepID=A0A8C2CXW9_CYPCA
MPIFNAFSLCHFDHIQRMNLDGDQRRIVSRVGRSILLDFHFSEGTMFWADTHAGHISRAGLDGTRRQLLSSVKGITGLAVDWIENTVLWSNAERGTIQRMDTDGRNKKIVLRDLSQPRSVVVDPNERYIFWLSDGLTPSLQRSDMNGGKRATVLKAADRLKVLAIDHRDRRLFWVQQGQGVHTAIGSCNYDGNIINVFNQPFRANLLHIGGLCLEGDTVCSCAGCNVHTGECVKVCSSHSDTGLCQCRDGFSLSKQGNYCEDINECALWNHGCSLGCENVPGSYFCTCPKGYLLLSDLKTCQEPKPCMENGTVCDHACVHTAEGDVCVCPEGSVLNSDGRSCTGCLSADRGGCSQMCVTLYPGRWVCECQPGYQLQPDGKHCAAAGPPVYLLFANTVDIRKINADGKKSKTLLQEPRGGIIALDYDPVQKQVYFADKSLKRIERASLDGGFREMLFSTGLDSPEGLAVDWVHRKLYWTDRGLSSISRSGLNGMDREIFIDEDIQKPRGIALHPQAQKVYWTDMGSRPAVERSGLNRDVREVVVSTGLVSPSGLAVDHGSQRLYWCDLSRGVIESANLNGSDRHMLSENQVGRPFDVAVFENVLWVSDWEGHLLYRIDMRTGRNPEHLRDISIKPAALVVVHPFVKPGANVCLHENGGCAQVCESRLGLAHCSCHSKHVLSADGKDCLPINSSFTAVFLHTEPEDGESSDRLRNKTLNDESTPLAMLYTERMVSDQNDCYSLRCDVNAQCMQKEGRAMCQCVTGFAGDGELCCMDIDVCVVQYVPVIGCIDQSLCKFGFVYMSAYSIDNICVCVCTDVDECKAGLADCSVSEAECVNTAGGYFCQCKTGFTGDGQHCMGSPLDVTSPWQHNDAVQSCPSTHDSYCLYDGVCFYFPEMESYACNCVLGYMGERCQFSDLEWWELQQAEEEKRRNMAIAMCIVLLITLLSIAACITYCCG